MHPNAPHYRQLGNQLRKCGYIMCFYQNTIWTNIWWQFSCCLFPSLFHCPHKQRSTWFKHPVFFSAAAPGYSVELIPKRRRPMRRGRPKIAPHHQKQGFFVDAVIVRNVGDFCLTLEWTSSPSPSFLQSQEVTICADIVSESQEVTIEMTSQWIE